MASGLEAGSVFPTFEHFLQTFNAYCHANRELFVRKNTVTVEAANKTIKREENKFPAAWVYKAIQFQCKHYGNYHTKGSGIRTETDTFKVGCQARLRLCANKTKHGLVITEVNLQHTNHPKIQTESDAWVYPESRHLTEEQKDEMYGLFALNVPAARIVQHFEVKHNVHLQSQDVHNHRVSYRKELTGGLSEEDATYRLFQDILKKDPGAVIEVVCDSRNIASIIFVQTSQMKEILCPYPSVLFLDTTYKVNTRSMPLFSVMVVDGNNSGQVVAYGLVINECAETVTKLMEVFVKYNSMSVRNGVCKPNYY